MRQWMIPPRIMCDKHLLGEHVEHHMFAGTINKGKSIQGYINNNCLEPKSLTSRHTQLAKEMERRGMNHQSELPEINLSALIETQLNCIIDKEQSLQDLIGRCEKCKKKYYAYKKVIQI